MGLKMKYATLFLVLAFVAQGTDAATYVVGDSVGWTIPSDGDATYAAWASKHTYSPGDILVFNFAAGVHDVAMVTKASYDSCSSTSPLSLQTVSPSSVTLTAAGTYYFICTFGQHCAAGQKLTLTVASTSAATPTTSPPAAAKPPAAASIPPAAATPPPAAATPPPAAATPPPAAAPTLPPTAAATPTEPPNAAPVTPSAASPAPQGRAPAPGPTTAASDSPAAPPSRNAATPPAGSEAPGGDSVSPPAPSSASRKAVATLAIGLGLVVMGVVC